MGRPKRTVSADGTIRCSRCRKSKYITEFYISNKEPMSRCKQCLQDARRGIPVGIDDLTRGVENLRYEEEHVYLPIWQLEELRGDNPRTPTIEEITTLYEVYLLETRAGSFVLEHPTMVGFGLWLAGRMPFEDQDGEWHYMIPAEFGNRSYLVRGYNPTDGRGRRLWTKQELKNEGLWDEDDENPT